MQRSSQPGRWTPRRRHRPSGCRTPRRAVLPLFVAALSVVLTVALALAVAHSSPGTSTATLLTSGSTSAGQDDRAVDPVRSMVAAGVRATVPVPVVRDGRLGSTQLARNDRVPTTAGRRQPRALQVLPVLAVLLLALLALLVARRDRERWSGRPCFGRTVVRQLTRAPPLMA